MRPVGLHWLLSFVPLLAVLVAIAIPQNLLGQLVKLSAIFAALHVLVVVVMLVLPLHTRKKSRLYEGVVLTVQSDQLLTQSRPYAQDYLFAMESYSSASTLAYNARRPLLLLCGLVLTLFRGFAKCRAELNVMAGLGGIHRRVLDDYDPVLLDMLIGICATAAIISYSLYTVSAETLVMHGTDSLIYTVPFVIYGIFRDLFLLHRRDGGGDPAASLLRDAHLLVAFFG